MTLGQKLRQTRLSKGLSQSQVAGGCVTRNMLSQIENDQASPSMRTLEHLARALDVSVGWLLSDEQTDAALEKMRRARTLFREEDYAGCLALFAQDAPSGDEMLLLCSQAAGMLAAQRLAAENFSGAKELAQQALDWNRRSLYASAQVQVQALDVLARCAIQEKQADEAVERYRTFYLERQSAVRYHFTMARFHLQQEHIQAAEREIWSIAELPDAQRAEYLILRGKIAARREQYENAALYFHQAQELPLGRMLERELYEGLEVCCRELGDYQQAYLYAFPLVIMDATRTASTNTRTATSNKAPINQFIHAEKLADATTRAVVTPNVDTIYTQAFLDVGAEPMIYGVPQTDRFFNVQVLDAWTNTAAVLETPGLYAITRADWQGELPEGVQRIDVPTTMVWTIARIVLSGQEDLPNVRAIQDKMQLMPLSAYQAGGWTAPAGSYDPANDFVPVKHVLAMDAKEFFDTANQLMETNPPAAADAPVLRELAALHIGPGEKFDNKALGLFSGLRWKLMLLQLKKKLQSESEFYTRQMGQWIYFGDPIGNFGTAYTYRAMVALRGLGANTTDVAIYPKTDVDSTGTVLTGKKTYTLHIEADPPTLEKGFWSVTAYGENDFLIENPIDRYCVNDRSGLHRNPDGSIDITLSKEAPADTTNWLPVGEGDFHLFLRIYKPDAAALTDWQPPVVRTN